MKDPNLQNAVSMSGQSNEYSDGILGEPSHLSTQHNHLSSPRSGDSDLPGYDFSTREDIDENQSPYSFDYNSHGYERGVIDNDYNSPDYGEDKAYYLPTSNGQETETQDLNYALGNHSENFSPYSTNSTQVNYAQSWEYSSQYSLGSFQNPYMNEPQLQNNSSLEDSDTDDNNSGNSNLSQNVYQNGSQNSTQASTETIAFGFVTFLLGLSATHNHISNSTHLEKNIMENNHSQNTSREGDKIKQQGGFGPGVNKGPVENLNTNIGVGLNDGKIKADTLIRNINEVPQKTLAETAAEIQQLLKQLEQSNPTETTAGQMAVVAQAVEIVENNPTLKQRVIGVLKSAGTEAFKEALDNPIANVLVAAFQGWIEA